MTGKDEISVLKLKVQDILVASAENGQLEHAFRHVAEKRKQKDCKEDVNALREKMRDILVQSAEDGLLEHAMKQAVQNREGSTDARSMCFSPDAVFSARMTPQPAAWDDAGKGLGHLLLQGAGCIERTPGCHFVAASWAPTEDAEHILDESMNLLGSWDAAAKTLQCMAVKAASGSPAPVGSDLIRELQSPAPQQQPKVGKASMAPSPCLDVAQTAVRGLVSVAMLSEDGRSTVADASNCPSPLSGESFANTSVQFDGSSGGYGYDRMRPPATADWNQAQDFAQNLIARSILSPFTEGCERSTVCDVTPEPGQISALEEARMRTRDALFSAVGAGTLAEALREAAEEQRQHEDAQSALARGVGAALDAASHEQVVTTLQTLGGDVRNKLRKSLKSDAMAREVGAALDAASHEQVVRTLQTLDGDVRNKLRKSLKSDAMAREVGAALNAASHEQVVTTLQTLGGDVRNKLRTSLKSDAMAREVGRALDAASHEQVVATLQTLGGDVRNKLRKSLTSDSLAREAGAALDAASHERIVEALQMLGGDARNKLRKALQSEKVVVAAAQVSAGTSKDQLVEEQLRLQMVEALNEALRDGSLDEFLSRMGNREKSDRAESDALRKNMSDVLQNCLLDGSLETALAQQAQATELERVRMEACNALEFASLRGALDVALQKATGRHGQARERVASQLLDSDRSGRMDRGVAMVQKTHGSVSRKLSKLVPSRGSTLEKARQTFALAFTSAKLDDALGALGLQQPAARQTAPVPAVLTSALPSPFSAAAAVVPLPPTSAKPAHTFRKRPLNTPIAVNAPPTFQVMKMVENSNRKVGLLHSQIELMQRQIRQRDENISVMEHRLQGALTEMRQVVVDLDWHQTQILQSDQRAQQLGETRRLLALKMEAQRRGNEPAHVDGTFFDRTLPLEGDMTFITSAATTAGTGWLHGGVGNLTQRSYFA
eukprot:TRINITY_DN9814_c0_g1_i2.p1 TRINITY_DN9814_c0_g1~~TRINITY_DN9814_c0_g1_i2.p1  ORF type:complete len:951 (-),score=220.66 TRINITY_DN9814_c0_g1_i2:281-3133(-)